MSKPKLIWKITGGFFSALFIVSLLFTFSMWFLVPPDPMGNVHGVDIQKAEFALAGILLAVLMFFLSRYSFRKATHEKSGT
jgi:hypothetical protein